MVGLLDWKLWSQAGHVAFAYQALVVVDGKDVAGRGRELHGQVHSRGTSIRLLVHSSFATGGNHLQRKTGTKGVRLVSHGGRQLFLQRTNKRS